MKKEIDDIRGFVRQVSDINRRLLTLEESLNLLSKIGIDVAETYYIGNISEVQDLSQVLKFPVVAKIVSEKITHKTDRGGVILNIQDMETLVKQIEKIFEQFLSYDRYLKVAIQPMIRGKEIFAGIKRDPVFGPTLMFGIGGIFVELIKDISIRILPVEKKELYDMIKEIKGFPVLRGYRSGKEVDLDNIVDTLYRLSILALEIPEIQEIDINPMIATDKYVLAVDSRIILK